MRDLWAEVHQLAAELDTIGELHPADRIRRTVELRARMMIVLAAVRHDAVAETTRALARLRRGDEGSRDGEAVGGVDVVEDH